jgi:hypothetical protein
MKNTFELGDQTINYVDNDAILLCCEPSFPLGGFVAAQFIIKNPTSRMTETISPYWGLATFTGGRFVLQPYTKCPWCKRPLPTIEVAPSRSALS